MEQILTVWKVSGQSEKFLKSLESFRIVYKVSGKSEKFPDNLRTLVYVGKDDLRAFGIHVAKTIYALRPESFCG